MGILNRADKAALKLNEKVEKTVHVGTDKHAVVRIAPSKERWRITVVLFNSNTNKRIKKIQKRIGNLEVADATIENLLRVADSNMEGNSDIKRHGSHKDFAIRVYDVPGVLDPCSYGVRRNGKYLRKSTVESNVSYTANTIGTMFDHYGTVDVTEAQQKEYFDSLIEKIQKQNNANARIAQTKDEIANGINTRWQYANEVLSICRANDPEGEWPKEPLYTFEKKKSYSPEMTKVLPYTRYIIAARLIQRSCEKEIQEAFAGIGLALRGMRVGESAAIKIKDIEYYDESLARYYICQQINSKAEPTSTLKNDSSYRYVPVFGLFWDLIEMRKKQLGERGLSQEEIGEAYLGSSYVDPTKPQDKTKVSSYLRRILVLSGCNDEDLRMIERAVHGEKGEDSDHDLSAHLFRRNFATYALNGGLSTLMVDALLGHMNKSNFKRDYAGWDTTKAIAGMLNRCFYFGSMTSKPNPSYSVIPISNISISAEGNREYNFMVENDGVFTGTIDSLEADDPLTITINGCGEEIQIGVQTVMDDVNDRHTRVVLPQLPSSEEIERCIQLADTIFDNSEFGEGVLNEK